MPNHHKTIKRFTERGFWLSLLCAAERVSPGARVGRAAAMASMVKHPKNFASSKSTFYRIALYPSGVFDPSVAPSSLHDHKTLHPVSPEGLRTCQTHVNEIVPQENAKHNTHLRPSPNERTCMGWHKRHAPLRGARGAFTSRGAEP